MLFYEHDDIIARLDDYMNSSVCSCASFLKVKSTQSVRGLSSEPVSQSFARVTRNGVNPELRTVVDLARGDAVMSRPMEECEVAILNGGDKPPF